jgi:ATP-binding cassette subfamily B protein
MSRVTNDVDTISQAFGFALVSVTSGILLLIWIAVRMLRESVPYALVSLAVVPLMWLVTNWFSDQARRAFATARIGRANADLQGDRWRARRRPSGGRCQYQVTSTPPTAMRTFAAAFTAGLSPALRPGYWPWPSQQSSSCLVERLDAVRDGVLG